MQLLAAGNPGKSMEDQFHHGGIEDQQQHK
jgi:hypothetical protein